MLQKQNLGPDRKSHPALGDSHGKNEKAAQVAAFFMAPGILGPSLLASVGHAALWLFCITLLRSNFADEPDIGANKIWPKSLALIKGRSAIARLCNFGFSLARGTCIFDPS
jgi:hypothetical protein